MHGTRDISVFVVYYVYVTSGPSLLIESTDSMIWAIKNSSLVPRPSKGEEREGLVHTAFARAVIIQILNNLLTHGYYRIFICKLFVFQIGCPYYAVRLPAILASPGLQSSLARKDRLPAFK